VPPADVPAAVPRPPVRRGRTGLVVAGVVLVVVLFSLRGIASAYTDYLWFDSVDLAAVWSRRLGVQVLLAVAFGLAFFAFFYVNLAVVDRLAPPDGTFGSDHPLERYRTLVGPHRRGVRLVSSLVFAAVAGAGSTAVWREWLLFRHGGDFGRSDPLHGVDLGFYTFRLPFLSYTVSWAFAAVVVVLMAVSLLHYVTGGIRVPGTGPVTSPPVKAHLSVLLALLALVKGVDYFLDRYRLTTSDRGFVRGALYADVHAKLPALELLVAVSLLAVVLLVVNIRRRGWALPAVTMGLWALVALVAGVAYPWFVQRFEVSGNPTAKEAPFLEDNIEATRFAYGLDGVRERDYDFADTLTDEAITANAPTIRNVRLLDPQIAPKAFSALESKLDYYQFTDIAVDRYEIDGKLTQVLLAARELRSSGVPRPSWEALHLIYTHGYGVAVAPANGVNADGEPEFVVGDVPARVRDGAETFELDRPEIYFGRVGADGATDYAIVGTTRTERSGGGETSYEGTGGVGIGSTVRKLAFALRFGEIEPLISNYLTGRSRILYVRDVRDRVEMIAPFLRWDSDPYPVVLEGRIVYVLDGFTTSDSVPYADSADTSDLPATRAGLGSVPFNYVRNSVKAVVDAYDGSVSMYRVDDLVGRADPLIEAWSSAFPDLFQASADLPDGLRDHLRYPEDLFRVQTTKWGRYHIEDPGDFYSLADRWDVAPAPPRDLSAGADGELAVTGELAGVDPYYLMMRLPGAETDEFLLFRPYAPFSEDRGNPKKQLSSFMVARSGRDDYGRLETYTMTEVDGDGSRQRNRAVAGPLTVHEKMISDAEVSEELTLLGARGGGSTAELGNMLVVPVDQGLLYVRPVYVRGESATAPSRLRKVIVAVGDRIAIGDTLAEALSTLFPDAEVDTLEGGTDPTPTTPSDPGDEPSSGTGDDDAADLVGRAVALLDEADAALRRGGAEGLAEYQEKSAAADELIRRADEVLRRSAGSASSSTTTTTEPGS